MHPPASGFGPAAHHRKLPSGTRRLSSLLAEASEVLASSLDVAGPVRDALDLVVPKLADWCVLDCPPSDELGASDAVKLSVHRDPEHAARLLSAARDEGGPGVVGLVRRVLHQGEPIVLNGADVDLCAELFRDHDHATLLRGAGLSAVMVAPLAARDQVFGTLTFGMQGGGRRFTPALVDTAVDLAHRIALTVDNGRLHQRLQRAVRAREELLAVVSHDLRTPLSAITTSVATLQRARELTPGRVLGTVEAIRRNARRMEAMIRDLLDFSQLESGRLRVHLRRERFADLVRGAVTAARPLAAARQLRLEITPDAEWVSVACDRDRVLQILGNLIDNALKFTPRDGRVTLRVWRAGDQVIASVADTGRGIDASELPFVFDAYRQGLDLPGGRARRSMGLGLSIARGLAEAHAGRLWVESTPGQGSTFYFGLSI